MKKTLITLSLIAMALAGGLFSACGSSEANGPIEDILTKEKIAELEKNYTFIADEFCQGLCRVSKGDFQDWKYGFINAKGEEVIKCQYSSAKDFTEGMAAFSKTIDGKTLWGFIDKTGKEVIPAKYRDAGSFVSGLAPVAIDKPNNDNDDDWGISLNEYLWGYINPQGEEVIKIQYTYAEEFTADGLAHVQKDVKDADDAYINTKGEEVLSGYTRGGNFSEGYAWVAKGISDDRQYMIIDTKGEVSYTLPKNMEFKHDAMFGDGLIPALKVGRDDEEKYGYINAKGETVIDFKYKDADNFKNGKAKVKLKKKRFYIDTKGTEIEEKD